MVKVVVQPRLFCLTFKTTRIVVVTQVHSVENPSPIVEGNYVILKDMWLDEDKPTEAENQDRMFADANAFIGKNDWRSDRRLKNFSVEMLERLEYLFAEKRYRGLFLSKLHAWRGIRAAPLPESLRHVFRYDYWGRNAKAPPFQRIFALRSSKLGLSTPRSVCH